MLRAVKEKDESKIQKLSPAEKRVLVRRAAFACFSQKGYHATTVDDVCHRAGISKGSFYWHYDSKQALFLDILEVWANEVEGALFKQFRDALQSPNPFQGMTKALEREARRNRRIVRLWLDSLAQMRGEAEIKAGLARFHRRIRSSIASLFRSISGMSHLGDDDVEALAACTMACFMGLLCQDQVDPEGASFTKQTRYFMSTLEHLMSGGFPQGAKNVG